MYPILFHFGHIALPTFGVLAAVGLMCGLWLSLRTSERLGLDAGAVWDAGVFLIVAAFASSRLLLVLGSFRTFLRYPVLLLVVPSLTAAGLGLTCVAGVGWLIWKKLPVLRVLDAWAAPGALVWGFLGVGHWAEGSDPGMYGQPGLCVAGLAFGLVLVLELAVERQGVTRIKGIRTDKSGCLAGVVLLFVGVGQFLIGFLREPGVAVWGLDLLQWVALGMVVCGGGLWVWVGAYSSGLLRGLMTDSDRTAY